MWNPKQYNKYAEERARPAKDLIAQISLENPKVIYDLGCGPGSVTNALQEKWPGAKLTGIDNSEQMLEKAKSTYPTIKWEQASISDWKPDEAADLIFSNAALHWIPDHPAVIKSVFESLNSGGVFAMQVPNNFKLPSHQSLYELASLGEWKDSLESAIPHEPILSREAYYQLLTSYADEINIWQTEYMHVLEGETPVLDWVKGSALTAFLPRLSQERQALFLSAYQDKLAQVYPKQANGKTLLTYRRLFIIARKP